jgi:hypothetical protein
MNSCAQSPASEASRALLAGPGAFTHVRKPTLSTAEIDEAGCATAVRETDQMMYMHLELKVCEGCGMLWLRRKQMDGNYCAGCVARLASFPTPGKHAGGRPRTSTAVRRNRGCAAARTPRRVTSSKAGAR